MKKIWLLVIAATAIIIISVLPLPGASAKNVQSEVSLSEQKPQEKPKYYMTVLSDIIAVYRCGETVPFKLLDVNADDLPPTDRKMLENKIYIYSDDELQRLIEDYNS